MLYREDRYFCLGHASADHRPPVAHHAARGADPVHPRPPAACGSRAATRWRTRCGRPCARRPAREAGRPPRARHRRGLGHRPRHRAPVPARGRRAWPCSIATRRRLAKAQVDGAATLVCDVADERQVRAAVAQAAAALGGLDGVVNSAGIDLMRPFEQMTAGGVGAGHGRRSHRPHARVPRRAPRAEAGRARDHRQHRLRRRAAPARAAHRLLRREGRARHVRQDPRGGSRRRTTSASTRSAPASSTRRSSAPRGRARPIRRPSWRASSTAT